MAISYANIVGHLKFMITLLSAVISIQIVATAQETITPLPDGSGWEIKQPDVTQPRENISEKQPALVFRKYDEVVVTGGGCVQTGGAGKTWKRYIDPAGNNSDRLYHGRIWIPGATDGLVRISSIVSVPLIVNKFPPHSNDWSDTYPLILGYEDDDYPDNNYQPGHKSDHKQCKLGNDHLPIDGLAWLKIQIIHHDASNVPASRDPRAPLDLWWNTVDDNFLPYNPDWWLHHQHGPTAPDPSQPYALDDSKIPNSTTQCNGFEESGHDFLVMGKTDKCTMSDPDVDEGTITFPFCHVDNPPLSSKSKRVHGHVNWGAVTYEGKIYFDVSNNGGHPPCYQSEFPVGDGDYDWLFATDGENGISAGNIADSREAHEKRGSLKEAIRAIALEFSSRETVDVMRAIEGDSSQTWWNQFHHDVDEKCGTARESVRGRKAIVIGLMGFDNEHEKKEKKKDAQKKDPRVPAGARIELHPVWGLAIRVEDGPDKERWVIFARNWGNEGSCSNGFDITKGDWQHWLPLPEKKMKFFLPSALGAGAQTAPDLRCAYYRRGDTPKQCDAPPEISTTNVSNGILMSIQLAQPEMKELVWGEVTIKK